MTYQIVEKKTGKVVEEKVCETERQGKSFLYYFCTQCNTKKYELKVKAEVKP